jgi:membrane-associated protease RseP (regulator of RpoE activity)
VFRNRWLLALVVFAGVAAHPVAARSQVVTVPGTGRGSILGFSYGWEGGFTISADGKRHMRQYPTVKSLVPGSPAERARLRVGDVIVSVNGRDARTPPFPAVSAGSRVVVRIRRGDAEREITYVARAAEGNPPAASRPSSGRGDR